MSKFMYSAIRSRSAWLRSSTYAVDPIRPSSSAPHQAKRSVFCGLWLPELLRELQQSGGAAAVVVDPGTRRDGVEMSAGHDDVVVVLSP